MTYKRIVDLQLRAAEYRASVSKRCKLPTGEWSPGTSAFILLELREQLEGLEQLDMHGILRCQYLVELACELRHQLRPASRSEILDMLTDAAYVAAARLQNRPLPPLHELRWMASASDAIAEKLAILAPHGP